MRHSMLPLLFVLGHFYSIFRGVSPLKNQGSDLLLSYPLRTTYLFCMRCRAVNSNVFFRRKIKSAAKSRS